MRRRLLLLAAGALLVTAALVLPARAAGTAPYVVLFADDVDALAKTADLERRAGFRADHHYVTVLSGFAARLSARQRKLVAADAAVVAVHEDRAVRLVDTGAPTRVAPSTGVRRVGGGTRASNVAVAVLDTGVDARHPDLDVASGVNCSGGATRRTAATGDENGHGTHVAGTIGGKGGTGVAPGTRIYAVKVLGADGGGSASSVICGIDWVTTHASRLGIKVASLSLGSPGVDDGDCGRRTGDPMHRAVCRSVAAGITYVVAAGNSTADLAGFVPASYAEVLAVTAMSDTDGEGGGRGKPAACGPSEGDDRAASFSNFATTEAEASHVIAAPGVCIRSTWPNRRYAVRSGTSMAAPHVSAAVALCISSGRCRGEPREVMKLVRADAAAHGSGANGFAAPAGRRYGDLVWAGY